jgi:hypothetical protein
LGAVNVPRNQHDLPKNIDKWLPKFNPDSRETPDDHIKKCILTVNMRSVEHEYVVCRIFPYIFEREASTWYFSLQDNSITNWDTFEDLLIKKFGDDKYSSILSVELSKNRMGPKEKIKDSLNISIKCLKHPSLVLTFRLNFILLHYEFLLLCLLNVLEKVL